jgi:hypothetical protein
VTRRRRSSYAVAEESWPSRSGISGVRTGVASHILVLWMTSIIQILYRSNPFGLAVLANRALFLISLLWLEKGI